MLRIAERNDVWKDDRGNRPQPIEDLTRFLQPTGQRVARGEIAVNLRVPRHVG